MAASCRGVVMTQPRLHEMRFNSGFANITALPQRTRRTPSDLKHDSGPAVAVHHRQAVSKNMDPRQLATVEANSRRAVRPSFSRCRLQETRGRISIATRGHSDNAWATKCAAT